MMGGRGSNINARHRWLDVGRIHDRPIFDVLTILCQIHKMVLSHCTQFLAGINKLKLFEYCPIYFKEQILRHDATSRRAYLDPILRHYTQATAYVEQSDCLFFGSQEWVISGRDNFQRHGAFDYCVFHRGQAGVIWRVMVYGVDRNCPKCIQSHKRSATGQKPIHRRLALVVLDCSNSRNPRESTSNDSCGGAKNGPRESQPIRSILGGYCRRYERSVGARSYDGGDTHQHHGKGPDFARSVRHGLTLSPRPPVVERYLHA